MNDRIVDTIPYAGGYKTTASILECIFKVPICRQNVWMWWSRRKKNGFPEGFMQDARNGRPIRWFHTAEVIDWYCNNYPDIARSAYAASKR